MRELTFSGFMKKYVAELSTGHTTAIYKLVREAVTQNARLKEPLYLYAASNGHLKTLLAASKKTALYDEYLKLYEKFPYPELMYEFAKGTSQLPKEYQKVWQSFCSVKGKSKRDERVKTMMAEKIKRLQQDRNVSTYRICRDLGLNNANVNGFSYTASEIKSIVKKAENARNGEVHRFVSLYNSEKIVDMLFQCTAQRIDDFRGALFLAYRNSTSEDFEEADRIAMQEMLDRIYSRKKNHPKQFDKL